ncbi:hypothetical protein HRbin33_02033 [bacterium HR33]|nr:hypothetical protein HRbin33_02033 [bacterium HR33]
MSVIRLATAVLRWRRVVWWTAIGGAGFGLGWTSISDEQYVCESSFVPHLGPYSRGAERIKIPGVASVPLVAWPEALEGPAFYEELPRLRSTLRKAAAATYSVNRQEGNSAGTLPEVLELSGDAEEERLEAAVRWLEKRVEARTDPLTGIVSLRTTAPSPELAAQLNARLLALVQAFVAEKRRQRGRMIRRFAEERLLQAERSLRQSEEELKSFLTQNREYRSSPRLQLEAERLMRRVQWLEQLRLSLDVAYQEGRLEEHRETPFITVIDSPTAPVEPSGPNVLAASIIFALVGSVIGTTAYATADRLRELGACRSTPRPSDR